MQSLKEHEAGVMFWVGRDSLEEIRSLGVRCGQLGIPGDLPLDGSVAAKWKADIDAASFTVVTEVAAYNGETYANIPTVERTVGVIPRATQQQRSKRRHSITHFP